MSLALCQSGSSVEIISKRRVGNGANRRAHAARRHAGFATLSPPYKTFHRASESLRVTHALALPVASRPRKINGTSSKINVLSNA